MAQVQLVTADALDAAVADQVGLLVPDISGVSIVHSFTFTFALATLELGHAFWTPTVGDVLLNAWLFRSVAWDGTSPTCDVGSFQGSNNGWFNRFDGTQDLTVPDELDQAGNGITFANTALFLPAAFTTADPIKIVVSQNGQLNGGATESTTGSTTLYWITSTPV